MSAGEIAHDTELALATTSGRLLVARSFREHDVIALGTAATLHGLPRDAATRKLQVFHPKDAVKRAGLVRSQRPVPLEHRIAVSFTASGGAVDGPHEVTTAARTVADLVRRDLVTGFIALEAFLATETPFATVDSSFHDVGSPNAVHIDGSRGATPSAPDAHQLLSPGSEGLIVPGTRSWARHPLDEGVRRSRWRAVSDVLEHECFARHPAHVPLVMQWAHGLSGSWYEAKAAIVFRLLGMHNVVQQFEVVDSSGKLIARPDFRIEGTPFTVEFDGRITYQDLTKQGRSRTFEKEKLRDAHLIALGFVPVHLMADAVRSPQVFAYYLRDAGVPVP
ncbi:hypothetical protein [Brevibacterium samyangense]